MGILVVLIFYAIVLTVLATISAAVLSVGTKWYLKGIPSKKTVFYAATFPFACVVFAGLWFIGYATANVMVFHHDPILGDGWFTDIGNGYAIEMIDVTDHGIIYPRQRGDNDINGPNAIQDVRRMQIAGTQIFGTRDTKVFQNFGSGKQGEDDFFALDTTSKAVQHFSNEAELAASVLRRNIALKLEPIASCYDRYRWGWFDELAGFTLFALPAYGFWRLIRSIRLKKRESISA